MWILAVMKAESDALCSFEQNLLERRRKLLPGGGGRVPDPGDPLPAGGRQPGAVGAEGDVAVGAQEGLDGPARRQVPDDHLPAVRRTSGFIAPRNSFRAVATPTP